MGRFPLISTKIVSRVPIGSLLHPRLLGWGAGGQTVAAAALLVNVLLQEQQLHQLR